MADRSRWTYGDSWERYPIKPGELWTHPESGSTVAVHDLRDGAPGWMLGAEMVYCDPPWSKGNANSFVTKAGLDRYVDSFDRFMDALFRAICDIGPKVAYLEIGKQHVKDFERRLSQLFPVVRDWGITYYRRSPCYLLRGGPKASAMDFSGLDDEETPLAAIETEKPVSVADLCTGRGLTMLAAHRAGATFYGTELNPRRLAVALDRAAKMGVRYICGR